MTQRRSFMSILGNFLGTNTKKESMTTYTQEQRDKVIEALRTAAGLKFIAAVSDAADMLAAPSASPAEIEQLRVQLAGCGVAAMQNTEASRAERAKPGDYGYSGSYAEVCKAVDREIALRAAPSASLPFIPWSKEAEMLESWAAPSTIAACKKCGETEVGTVCSPDCGRRGAAPSASPDAQDAARYRWLRDNMNYKDRGSFTARNGEIMSPMSRVWYHQTPDFVSNTLDAVVDAAIKGGE